MGKTKALNHKPPIALWKPTAKDIVAKSDGKMFTFDFFRFFGEESVRKYSNFFINKTSYEKQLDQIANHINYFISKYDVENELAAAYLRIKFYIDDPDWTTFDIHEGDDEEKRLNIITKFIEFVHDELFGDGNKMVEHINKFVDDNYFDDIENNEGRKKQNDKEYLESLEFTNEHVKVMLRISFAMKVISPIMFHYFYLNRIKIEKNSDLIYRFYRPLFTLFGENKVNLFNKLYVYVKSRVLESNSINGAMFEKRQIFGIDTFVVVDMFVKKVLISENMVKYSFPENWDEKNHKYAENIVGFNKTIIKFQLSYFIKEVYDKNLTEVTNIKNSEGLSGSDKMEMNIRKMDEGKAVMATLNAEFTSEQIKTLIDIPISQEEIKYMEDHWKPHELQIRMIRQFIADYMNNYRDSYLITRENFYYFALLIKKKLLLESGWEPYDKGVSERAVLPYILTGNLTGKLNSRIIRNNKYIDKLDEDTHYRMVCDDQYSLLLEIKPDEIKSIISTLVNSRFTYVTPEDPDATNMEIPSTEDKVGSEASYFMYSSHAA